jgi:hypothetical protein
VAGKGEVAVVGIDPGTAGALCLLVPGTQQTAFMATTERPVDLYQWFLEIDNQFNLVVCMIEEVGFIRGSAGKSTFSFGRNVERVNIIPELACVPVDSVRPKAWQKFVGLVVPAAMSGESNAAKRKTYIKKEVARLASRLYPNAELHGPKGGLKDGRSDALMIAHYAARTINIT